MDSVWVDLVFLDCCFHICENLRFKIKNQIQVEMYSARKLRWYFLILKIFKICSIKDLDKVPEETDNPIKECQIDTQSQCPYTLEDTAPEDSMTTKVILKISSIFMMNFRVQ